LAGWRSVSCVDWPERSRRRTGVERGTYHGTRPGVCVMVVVYVSGWSRSSRHSIIIFPYAPGFDLWKPAAKLPRAIRKRRLASPPATDDNQNEITGLILRLVFEFGGRHVKPAISNLCLRAHIATTSDVRHLKETPKILSATRCRWLDHHYTSSYTLKPRTFIITAYAPRPASRRRWSVGNDLLVIMKSLVLTCLGARAFVVF